MRTRPARSLAKIALKFSAIFQNSFYRLPSRNWRNEKQESADLVLTVAYPTFRTGLFALRWAFHHVANRITGWFSFVQDSVHLFGDGQLDIRCGREIEQGRGGSHSLSHHFHLGENLFELASLAKLNSDVAVAAQRTVACQYQVAKSGKAAHGFRFPAKPRRQPRHFRQTSRDQSRKRIRAKAQPATDARGDGNHVLHRASELYAEYIVVCVKAKSGAGKFSLDFTGRVRVVAPCYARQFKYRASRNDDCCWFAASGLQGERRSGQDGHTRGRRIAQNIVSHFAHTRM